MVDRGTYPNRGQPGGYDAYTEVMADFIRDVRKELSAPELPFVIGVIGVGGPVDKYRPSQQRYKEIHQNIRDAMAAPAVLPEFKGNVAAVLTENYWDQQLTDLRTRDAAIKQKVKKLQSEGKLSREEAKSMTEKLQAEEFSDREREILQKGVSNAEYHYLGCAKIMAQIGKGFAEALEELRKD
jgi:DNA repair ATPase RecN